MINHTDNVVKAGGINIVHLNVASMLIPRKFEMLRQQVQRSHVDIFCASETWLTECKPDGLIELKGYNVARLDRAWADCNNPVVPKKGGGLICYIKEKLNFNEFKYKHLNQSNINLEMQWIVLEQKSMRKVVIINIYRPPQGDYKVACKLIQNAIRDANLKDNVIMIMIFFSWAILTLT